MILHITHIQPPDLGYVKHQQCQGFYIGFSQQVIYQGLRNGFCLSKNL